MGPRCHGGIIVRAPCGANVLATGCRVLAMAPMRLALFDLDHTLLSGDSDLLWCDFLVHIGLLDRGFTQRNRAMAAAYTAGSVIPADYCNFYAATLAGHGQSYWLPVQQRFLQEVIRPRIPADARALLRQHRESGHTLVLTTATNRVVSELTALDLGVDHHLATEVEVDNGLFTGRTQGVPNMRTGKVERLRAWLLQQGQSEAVLRQASFYTDSINDLPLLSVVGRPVVVDPDPRLESAASRNGWKVLRFTR
jgi:HAD superfamily hydrolase (TIGR01490 family)